MNKTKLLMIIVLLITLIPFGKGICFPIMNNDSNYLSVRKSFQEYSDLPFNSSVDENIAQMMLEGKIPSLAASVVYKDDIIWSKGYGKQSDDNVAFIIASITKTFTSTGWSKTASQ